MASYSVPVECSASSTASSELQIAAGHIADLEVEFPQGCVGLVKVTIDINGSQEFPAGANRYYSGEGIKKAQGAAGFPIPTNSHMKINVTNDDDTYPHTPIIKLDITEQHRGTSDYPIGSVATSRIDLRKPKKKGLFTRLLEGLI